MGEGKNGLHEAFSSCYWGWGGGGETKRRLHLFPVFFVCFLSSTVYRNFVGSDVVCLAVQCCGSVRMKFFFLKGCRTVALGLPPSGAFEFFFYPSIQRGWLGSVRMLYM